MIHTYPTMAVATLIRCGNGSVALLSCTGFECSYEYNAIAHAQLRPTYRQLIAILVLHSVPLKRNLLCSRTFFRSRNFTTAIFDFSSLKYSCAQFFMICKFYRLCTIFVRQQIAFSWLSLITLIVNANANRD